MLLNKVIVFFTLLLLTAGTTAVGRDIYVAPNGNDQSAGSLQQPVATLQQALHIARKSSDRQINIFVRKGVYYLENTLVIEAADFKGKALQIAAWNNEAVTLSGGTRFSVQWRKYDDHLYAASVPLSFSPDALYLDGREAILARYPNYNAQARIFNGTAADAISPERVKTWADPSGGFFHALHSGEWGSFHYRITGKDADGQLQMEGGWQNNRPSPPHKEFRFVENIREELDAPGEWYYDLKTQTLYYYPPEEVGALPPATVTFSHLKTLIHVKGSAQTPMQYLRMRGFKMEHTARVLMEKHEPLLRSDWMLHRAGAVTLEGTRNSSLTNCEFSQLGATAIMVSGYHRNLAIKGNHIHHTGGSGICFVGEVSAVRSPLFRYESAMPYEAYDKTPGPQNNHYPSGCVAEDNLIYSIGRIEKQATGVEISMSQSITVKNNTIYNTPRAGINIGDGTWGGHVIAYNDVFNTVQETGDHGAFNSWGRDRFWHPNRAYMDSLAALHPESILLDAQKTTIIRNNRFRCDHGWDIDLDDGSSNYHIYNNICLNGGLKLREGFYRTVENNIMINNSFHPHVWFKNSGDVFRKNIVTRNYYPIIVPFWGKMVDYNLFPDTQALQKAQANHTDAHSLAGNPQFVRADVGNYTLSAKSPALKLGFKNIPTQNIGVKSPRLKALAQKAPITPLILPLSDEEKDTAPHQWLDATLRNVSGLGDRSAFGLNAEEGVIVVSVQDRPGTAGSGLKANDVIVAAEGTPVRHFFDLISQYQKVNWTGKMNVSVQRNQQVVALLLRL